jgi:hypothetical protein
MVLRTVVIWWEGWEWESRSRLQWCGGVYACGFTWPQRQLVVRSNYFCDGWSWQPAGDQEQAKPELSRAHTVGSALGRIVTWSTDAQIFCLWPMTGFTKSFESVDLQNRLSWRNLDWFFCFLNKKTGSLCIVNDVVLFNIFLLQIFSNFKILNFKRPRWTGKTIPVRFPVLLASHRFFNPTSVRPKIPQGGGAWGHESHEATALEEVSTRKQGMGSSAFFFQLPPPLASAGIAAADACCVDNSDEAAADIFPATDARSFPDPCFRRPTFPDGSTVWSARWSSSRGRARAGRRFLGLPRSRSTGVDRWSWAYLCFFLVQHSSWLAGCRASIEHSLGGEERLATRKKSRCSDCRSAKKRAERAVERRWPRRQNA